MYTSCVFLVFIKRSRTPQTISPSPLPLSLIFGLPTPLFCDTLWKIRVLIKRRKKFIFCVFFNLKCFFYGSFEIVALLAKFILALHEIFVSKRLSKRRRKVNITTFLCIISIFTENNTYLLKDLKFSDDYNYYYYYYYWKLKSQLVTDRVPKIRFPGSWNKQKKGFKASCEQGFFSFFCQ